MRTKIVDRSPPISQIVSRNPIRALFTDRRNQNPRLKSINHQKFLQKREQRAIFRSTILKTLSLKMILSKDFPRTFLKFPPPILISKFGIKCHSKAQILLHCQTQKTRTFLNIPSFSSPNLASNVSEKLRCSSIAKPRKLVVAMGSINREVTHEFRFFRVFKDGTVEKFRWPPEKIPPSDDPITGVRSKDVTISTQPDISARVFLPQTPDPKTKLPVLFYVHGGGFSFESAFSPLIDRHVRTLAAGANAMAVSVEYRLAPEHPIPACYDDCWAALRWVGSHANGHGPEPWLNHHADFQRLFLAGDSAGGNICHTLAVRVGTAGLDNLKVVGAVMGHPYFGGNEDDEMWLYMCPTNEGLEDRRLKPAAEDLARIGCERVLVLVAEKDHLMGVGRAYYEELKKSGWKGTVEIVESEGEDHCFHVDNPTCESSVDLIKKIVSFINEQ